MSFEQKDDPLADFHVVIEQPVKWGEMDAFQHVNNVVYFRYFENFRIEYFRRLGYFDLSREEGAGVGPILAATSCKFIKPVTFPDDLRIGGRAFDLKEDRFSMFFRVVSRKLGRVAAEGDALIVSYDYVSGKKAPLPESVRAAILELEGER